MAVTDGDGTSTHVYGYDDIYQVTDVNYPEEFDYLATDTTFNYDKVGNRTSVVDESGTVTYTANELAENGDSRLLEGRDMMTRQTAIPIPLLSGVQISSKIDRRRP